MSDVRVSGRPAQKGRLSPLQIPRGGHLCGPLGMAHLLAPYGSCSAGWLSPSQLKIKLRRTVLGACYAEVIALFLL